MQSARAASLTLIPSPASGAIQMSETSIPDAAARRRALDLRHSFIVQAPAGAGKTELLTQRYLVLLGAVERPEEILAVTFTKKAVAEMRARVLDAVTRAGAEAAPESAHQRHTWELARRARERDRARGWRIEENPGRLRIQTIDSFCFGLTQQMPLLARFGAPPAIVEDATELYREAAYATLADTDTRAAAVEHLLAHLDNDLRRAAALLADMLARRDQWLRHVADRNDPRLRRETLEQALADVIAEALAASQRALPAELEPALLALAQAAAANLHATGIASPIGACLDLGALPRGAMETLPVWIGLAELLLTSDGKVRAARGINKRQGFPAQSDGKSALEREAYRHAKDRMAELLERSAHYPEFIERLHALRGLPPACYSEAQWAVLQALIDVLPLAAAQLKLVFAARGQVDFTEIAQGALSALGEPEAPTDLLLALDDRLQHVLVDEFQDTSVSQFELVRRLTAGWTPGDGRTLFLVGDPMQSIYRFREAEVGLYLRATHHGIGTVALEKLTLSANFRSGAGVVDWVNRAFARIFPIHEDSASGAVRYAPCEAVRPAQPGPAVSVYPFFDDATGEAEQVVALVQAARARDPAATTAILVRNRAHLAAIVPQLRHAGLSFRAIEIERLAERQVVQDLLALTRALLHLGDRTAWLALLRAPWCGLMLADLEALVGDRPSATVWELLQDETRVARLSTDGQRRLGETRAVLGAPIAGRGRSPLRRHVEGTWLALGGPACLAATTELADAEAYLQLLDDLDECGAARGAIAEHVAKLFAGADVAGDDRLQIMTIHKAKGLEFDVVIVPGLGRRPRAEATRLLQWTERARELDEPQLLLAPVRATGTDGDSISHWLRDLDKARARNEELRLLYVAATRVRESLHLLGHVPLKLAPGEPVPSEPASGSLLAALWPVVAPLYEEACRHLAPGPAHAPAEIEWGRVQQLTRLRGDWQLPAAPAPVAVELEPPVVALDEAIEFAWVGETARHVGTVVHRWLLRIADDGLAGWSPARIAEREPAFRIALVRLGVPAPELAAAVGAVGNALANVLQDERARWLLGPWSEARSEYPLSGVLDGRVVNVVLDRTFVDNDGARWIVDYKTSLHAGGEREAFLDSERLRYTAQLMRYARLLAKTESRPVKLGLYFPLLRGWREWEFQNI